MSTTTHELETVQIQGLKAALQDGGNVGIYNKATCSTAGGTAAKVTNTVPKSFSLVSEATIFVKFTYTISVANATLKVGNNDAKPIYYRNAPLPANVVKAGDILTLRYNGTQFEVINSLGETYESKQASSGGTDLSLVTTGEKYAWNDKISSSAKGAANGVAELDANGKVPASQLPSYVDDIIEGYYKKADGKFYEESTYTTEITGESGKVYTDLSTDTTYRWSGTQFTQIKGDLAIGTTTGTAADGGIVNTHVNDTDIHVTLQDKSNWSGKQDALVFNTAYDATTNKVATMADVPDAQIQSDWNQTTSTAKDYIKNKPTNLVHSGTASGSANQADFNANADTVHNKAQVLSSTQQGQARKNINAANIDEAVICIEANSAPTTSTLSYTDSFGTSRNYKVGDQVKVYDSTEGKYKIYTLFNINNGTATWEQGGGGVAQKSYSVLISSNQSDTTDIANAKVTYDGTQYGNGDTISVSQSTDITAADLTVSSITGYSSSVQVTGLVIMVTYSTEILTVSITATDAVSGVSACSVVVTDSNSTTLGTLTNGQSLKIPYGTTYTCTPSTAPAGYTAPLAITKDWNDIPSKALTFTYESDLVDLGLSVMWAKGNICKNGNSYYVGEPTDYGCYFSWGNTEGRNEGEGYDFSSSTYPSTAGASLTGSIASNDSAHDAALACLGTGYRMPTEAELQELIDNCTFTWVTSYDGVNVSGGIFKSNKSGYIDKEIFIPASGYYDGTTLKSRGALSINWASTYNNNTFVYGMSLDSNSANIGNDCRRAFGFLVRAVI